MWFFQALLLSPIPSPHPFSFLGTSGQLASHRSLDFLPTLFVIDQQSQPRLPDLWEFLKVIMEVYRLFCFYQKSPREVGMFADLHIFLVEARLYAASLDTTSALG